MSTKQRAEPVHESREQETWDNVSIRDSMRAIEDNEGPLPEIPAREGFMQRWMRTKLAGEDDPKNIAKSINQHWRRRDPSTIPSDLAAPTVYLDGIGNTIGISGMVLRERPVEINDQYKDRVKERTKTQMSAVDNSLYKDHSVNDGFGAVHREEDKTRVSVGQGMPVDD